MGCRATSSRRATSPSSASCRSTSMVEATGRPLAAARHAMLAIEADKHIALVTKELDSVVGPGLKKLAADRGRVVTTVDGDQPSLLIGLISWAEVLGFDLIAAGKSSEYDFVFDPVHGPSQQQRKFGPYAALSPRIGPWATATSRISSRRGARLRLRSRSARFRICASSWSSRMRPGLQPDRPDLHAPIARIGEVPTIFHSSRGRRDSLRASAGSTCSIACARPTRSASPAASSW